MRFSVDFNWQGVRRIQADLLRTGERAEHAGPAFEAIGDLIMDIEEEQFDTQGARTGRRWAAIKPETIARKLRRGEDPRILHATLRLRESLTNASHPDQIFHVVNNALIFGSSVFYGEIHQNRGLGRGRKRRRAIDFTPRDRRDIIRVMQRWIIRGEIR